MKTTRFTLALLLLFIGSISFAQPCPIPNGSFETWEDVTESFDDSGTLPDGTIMLPEAYFGLLRLIVSSVTELFEAFTGEELIEASASFFGLYQSTDATDGEYSLQMQPDAELPFVDAITAFPCGEDLPTSFCFDLKHIGGGADTITIVGTFGNEATLGFEESELTDASGYFIVDTLILEGDSEWTSFNIPIIDNMNGVSPDTALIYIVMSSNQDSLTAGVESSYLVDNLNLKMEVVLPLSIASLVGTHENNYNNISWSVLHESNISHYTIERSYDNLADWEELAELNINPQGSTNYSYKDHDISKRGTYYYRVRQIDLNGNISLSQVLNIEVPIISHLSLVTYPNPAIDQLTLDIFLSENADQISYRLISTAGKKFDLFAQLPSALPAGYHKININVADLPSGVYNLIVESQFTEVKERIIISK